MKLERQLRHAIESRNKESIDQVYEEIYYEYGNLVGFIISKYIDNKADVEELINEVFLRFFQRTLKTEIIDIKYYLVVQAKNITVDFLKNKDHKLEVVYDDNCLLNLPVDTSESLFYQTIDDMNKYLSSEEINIIVWHTVYSLSFTEIADKLRKPVSTINSSYHRAIKRYRRKKLCP